MEEIDEHFISHNCITSIELVEHIGESVASQGDLLLSQDNALGDVRVGDLFSLFKSFVDVVLCFILWLLDPVIEVELLELLFEIVSAVSWAQGLSFIL